MGRFINAFFRKTNIVADPAQQSIVANVCSIAARGAFAFTILGTLGIDTSPLIAAAGITGATIGFACRDYGANIVAGVALVGQPCFRAGKRVSIGLGANKISGTMDHWDLRYMYLRGDDGSLLMVPNNYVLNSVISIDKPKQEDIEATWKHAQLVGGSETAAAEGANGAKPTEGKDEPSAAKKVAAQPVVTAEDKMWKDAAQKHLGEAPATAPSSSSQTW
ncbi:Hypothetical protein, putative [Bodo saltans]|uniref:Mechanosensitive ion channel protein n=1 Tax=Bodo saltans TaxID=75058 RepID=A0A0S4JFG0_BODSA|nr:Hypothetical protein, putative [Bodo saltans]|eukprot:CUG87124.1 Hypothetical protein, putative [Bodo saltans]